MNGLLPSSELVRSHFSDRISVEKPPHNAALCTGEYVRNLFIAVGLLLVSFDSNSNEVLKSTVNAFLKAYAERDYTTAVSQVFCPPSLSENQILIERSVLAEEIGSLTIGQKKLVKVTRLKNYTYSAVILA